MDYMGLSNGWNKKILISQAKQAKLEIAFTVGRLAFLHPCFWKVVDVSVFQIQKVTFKWQLSTELDGIYESHCVLGQG